MNIVAHSRCNTNVCWKFDLYSEVFMMNFRPSRSIKTSAKKGLEKRRIVGASTVVPNSSFESSLKTSCLHEHQRSLFNARETCVPNTTSPSLTSRNWMRESPVRLVNIHCCTDSTNDLASLRRLPTIDAPASFGVETELWKDRQANESCWQFNAPYKFMRDRRQQSTSTSASQ